MPRNIPSDSVSLPLGYYVVLRGWRVPSLHKEVLSRGWSKLQDAVACACDEEHVEAAKAGKEVDVMTTGKLIYAVMCEQVIMYDQVSGE